MTCPCGQEPTVLHISWTCPLFSDIRKPIAHIDFQKLPTCTQYAALIPNSLTMSDQQIILIQQTLVLIWQAYIQDYKSGKRSELSQNAEHGEVPAVDQNGHMLKPRQSNQPGVWSCKCGKYVARSKHIRLKITNKPCFQKNSTVILEQDGFHQSEKRLDDALDKLLKDYKAKSKHTLEWNRKLGKIVGREDEGKINCTACGRTWKWKDRANMRNTICKPIRPQKNIVPPQRSADSVVPSARLRQKTTPENVSQFKTSKHDIPSSSTDNASSSTLHPQPPGSSNDDVVRRKGIG